MPSDIQSRPVDLAHLGRYTNGDLALNSEVLQLFRKQAAELIGQLEAHRQAGETKGWREVAHSLKGGARGIGAFDLADAFAAAESFDPRAEPDKTAVALQILKAKAEAVWSFIDSYVSG